MSGPRGGIAFLSFSEKGAALAEALRRELGGEAVCAHGAEGFSLSRCPDYFPSAWAYPRREAL